MKKTWIKIKRGLLEPKHRDKMGPRIWLYLYMLDRADWQQGAVLDWHDEAVATEFQMETRTVRDQRQSLEADGYIASDRTGRGLRVTILNWTNPREYSGKVYNPPGMAVRGKSSSDTGVSLDEIESDTPSDTVIDTLSDTAKQHPSLESQITSSQVIKNGGPPAASRSQTHWVQILTRLQGELPRATFETWVRDTQVVSEARGEFVVGTANAYGCEWLTNRLTAMVEHVAAEVVGTPIKVHFVVMDPLAALAQEKPGGSE